MDRLDTLQAFITVAREGSFTKAADKLNLSSQLVSKYVAQLESELTVRLFNRTTRRVHLTEAGEQCLVHANHILDSMNDMQADLGRLQNQAQGLLRISAPVSFATLHLGKLISEFKAIHPAVEIDIQLNDRKVDVIEEGFDVVLRIGQLKSSTLIAKPIAPIRLVVCASPEYLEKNGTPSHPEQLIPEDYLRYSYMEYNQAGTPLIDALKQHSEIKEGISANNGQILTTAAIAGQGYVYQPTFIAGEAIKQGELKIILEDFETPPIYLYAVYPHRKLLTTKLRAFIDFMDGYFGEPPYWDQFDE